MLKRHSDIRATDWSPRLHAHGEVVEGMDDIVQCIGIILTTPRGSDPHRPTFGCDLWRYIDHPIGEAIPGIVREATDALRQWEPRIEVERIIPAHDHRGDAQAPARLWLSVEWRLKGGAVGLTTEVRL